MHGLVSFGKSHSVGKIEYPIGKPDPDQDVLWRCHDRHHTDAYDRLHTRIEMWWYPITKRTAKGAWICPGIDRRFVLLGARKKWAYETQEEAMRSYKIRKSRQVGYLTAQLREAKHSLAAAKKYLTKKHIRTLQ